MNLSYLMNLVPAHEPALRPLLRQIRLRLALPPHSLITKSFTATLRCPRWFVIICEQHQVESWLNVVSVFFEGTNTLIVLDDCAASEDVKGRTSELVNVGFSARLTGISVWVLTQLQLSSIAKPFREKVVTIVLFYTPSAKTTKAIFEAHPRHHQAADCKAEGAQVLRRRLLRRRKSDDRIHEPAESVVRGVQAAVTPGPYIPALREQLAILISSGKAKEAIGVQLTHEQVKHLDAKDTTQGTRQT